MTSTNNGYITAPSKIDGTGVFATKNWAKRKKIGELTGEFISKREVRRLAQENKRIHIYEFNSGYALHILNDLRYMNHSCKPNAFLRVVGDRIDGVCRIEVYALRNIQPGDEMTLNYGPYTHHEGTLRCNCGQCSDHKL